MGQGTALVEGTSRAGRGMAVAMGLAAALLLALPAAAFAGYINYPDFKRTSGLELNGTAHVVGDAVRLTDDYGQAASVFTVPSAIDATQPFHASFTFSLQDDGGGQADGFTFAVQREGGTVPATIRCQVKPA